MPSWFANERRPTRLDTINFDGPLADGTYYVASAHLCQPCRNARDVWAHRWNMGGLERIAVGNSAPPACDDCVDAARAREFVAAAQGRRS